MPSLRVVSLLAALLLPTPSAWALPPVGSSPVLLDGEPLRPPAFISAGALDGTVLVAWNSTASGALTVHWTLVDADGGMLKPPDAGPMGEFSFYPVHVAPAPDAGMWLVVLPDKSGGGVLGGARVFADGGQPDGLGATLSTSLSSVHHARAAWSNGAWTVVERNGSAADAVVVNTLAQGGNPAPMPELTGRDFEVASDGLHVFAAWPADGGAPSLAQVGSTSGATPRSVPEAAGSVAVAVAASADVVLLAWTTPANVRTQRYTRGLLLLDPAPVTVDTGRCSTVRASFDGRDFLLVWTCQLAPTTAAVRVGRLAPRGAAPAEVSTQVSGQVEIPEIAGVQPGRALLAWAAGDGGPTWPHAMMLSYDAMDGGGALDAGDTVIVDAGTPDGGAPDSGAADGDGGATADAGPESDAGTQPEAHQYAVGCAGTAGNATPLLLLLLAASALAGLRRRPRRRPG